MPFDAEWRMHHEHSSESAPEQDHAPSTISRTRLVEDFQKSLEMVGGHCAIVSDENKAAEEIRKVISTLAASRIAISDSELIKRLVDRNGKAEVVENAPAAYLFDCDLGITSAQLAIAETGTLVLESDQESHRLTSLVPPVHLCVLKTDNIRQTLGEILEITSRDLSRTVTFITGASRTSDIELTLAIGVHGPGELHVIVIAD